MTTDERIKLVREAIKNVASADASYTRSPRHDSYEWLKATYFDLGERYLDIAAILDEREAEREVVEAAIEWTKRFDLNNLEIYEGHSDYSIAVAVRRLLEVRKEREKE